MHKIILNKKKYSLPSSFAELTQKQLYRVLPFIFNQGNPLPSASANGIKTMDIKIFCLLQLMPIPKKYFYLLSPEQLYDLTQCINFLFTENPSTFIIKQFIHKGITWHSPLAKLSSSVIIEYAFADFYFNELAASSQAPSTKHQAPLDKLIATLYRPAKKNLDIHSPDYDGDHREKYNSELTDKRAEQFKNLDPKIKTAILLFFIGCKKQIAAQYPSLFETIASDSSTEAPNTKHQAPNNLNWFILINSLSKTGQYGDYQKTQYTNLHIILLNLFLDQQENKKKKTA